MERASKGFRVMKYNRSEKNGSDASVVTDENFGIEKKKDAFKFDLSDCDRDSILAPIQEKSAKK